MPANELFDEVYRRLSQRGVKVSEEWLVQCIDHLNRVGPWSLDAQKLAEYVYTCFLHFDLHLSKSSERSLPPDLENFHKKFLFMGNNVILQIDEAINISASLNTQKKQQKKEFENNPNRVDDKSEGKGGRVNKLHLTDGHSQVVGIDINGTIGNFYKGQKIAVRNVFIRHGALILTSKSCTMLGGKINQIEIPATSSTIVIQNQPALSTNPAITATVTLPPPPRAAVQTMDLTYQPRNENTNPSFLSPPLISSSYSNSNIPSSNQTPVVTIEKSVLATSVYDLEISTVVGGDDTSFLSTEEPIVSYNLNNLKNLRQVDKTDNAVSFSIDHNNVIDSEAHLHNNNDDANVEEMEPVVMYEDMQNMEQEEFPNPTWDDYVNYNEYENWNGMDYSEIAHIDEQHSFITLPPRNTSIMMTEKEEEEEKEDDVETNEIIEIETNTNMNTNDINMLVDNRMEVEEQEDNDDALSVKSDESSVVLLHNNSMVSSSRIAQQQPIISPTTTSYPVIIDDDVNIYNDNSQDDDDGFVDELLHEEEVTWDDSVQISKFIPPKKSISTLTYIDEIMSQCEQEENEWWKDSMIMRIVATKLLRFKIIPSSTHKQHDDVLHFEVIMDVTDGKSTGNATVLVDSNLIESFLGISPQVFNEFSSAVQDASATSSIPNNPQSAILKLREFQGIFHFELLDSYLSRCSLSLHNSSPLYARHNVKIVLTTLATKQEIDMLCKSMTTKER